jgi:DNA-binding NarL/FixJ family response regulator
MDIAMPVLNGLEATRQILKAVPGTRILILTAHNDDAYVKNATKSGAMGFLLKQASARVLSEGIREVNKGHAFFGPFIAKLLPERERKPVEQAGRPKLRKGRLTSREMEVLQLIAEGKANKQIAAELGISIKTIESHREHLMEKLNIHGIAGLTRRAIGAGIIESSVQVTIV